MDSDSDDEYWGTYQRLPQEVSFSRFTADMFSEYKCVEVVPWKETTRLPFSSFSSQGVSQSPRLKSCYTSTTAHGSKLSSALSQVLIFHGMIHAGQRSSVLEALAALHRSSRRLGPRSKMSFARVGGYSYIQYSRNSVPPGDS